MQSETKIRLRTEVRERVKALSAGDRASASRLLCARAGEVEAWSVAHAVMLFSPLPDEPDISPLLEAGWRAGKRCALPRFDAASGHYLAAQVCSPDDLIAGKFGAREPTATCPAVPLNQLDLILVPAVAFDPAGRRLGRGKGFYDRLLAEVRGHKCGIAFDQQIVAAVPEEPHDVRVDSILTPTRWHVCPRAA